MIPLSCCSCKGNAGNSLSSSFISSCFLFRSRSSLSLRAAPFSTRPVAFLWLLGICGVDSCSWTFLHISSLENRGQGSSGGAKAPAKVTASLLTWLWKHHCPCIHYQMTCLYGASENRIQGWEVQEQCENMGCTGQQTRNARHLLAWPLFSLPTLHPKLQTLRAAFSPVLPPCFSKLPPSPLINFPLFRIPVFGSGECCLPRFPRAGRELVCPGYWMGAQASIFFLILTGALGCLSLDLIAGRGQALWMKC